MGWVTEYLGAEPRAEAAVGTYAGCRLYLLAVRLVVGDEPPGAALTVAPAPPGRPHPFEVAVAYDPADPAAAAYARRCREQAPDTWAAAGLDRPVDSPRRMR